MSRKSSTSMHLPDYRGGSIVNLMSSILRACGVGTIYKPLRRFKIETLRRSTNIVLLVVDGLGYEYLKRHGATTKLRQHIVARMTSVFPSTTATGITTFATGVAPQQHAITGWFTFLKELGTVVRILPFNPRYGGAPLDTAGITPAPFIGHDTVFQQIETENYCLAPSYLSGSAYTTATSRGASIVSYDTLNDCFNKIAGIIGAGGRKKFIYAYWAEFDSLSHEFGTESDDAQTHLKDIDRAVEAFATAIQGSRTTVLITSDHGLIDTGPADRINLHDHPELSETLTLPLCGEPRVAYCYVHPARAVRFRQYIRTRLADHCVLYNSRDLIKKNFFGLHEPSSMLADRIGDYVLIMKDRYVIRDFLAGENEHFLSANHGGVSRAEMYVPLIRMTC